MESTFVNQPGSTRFLTTGPSPFGADKYKDNHYLRRPQPLSPAQDHKQQEEGRPVWTSPRLWCPLPPTPLSPPKGKETPAEYFQSICWAATVCVTLFAGLKALGRFSDKEFSTKKMKSHWWSTKSDGIWKCSSFRKQVSGDTKQYNYRAKQ